MDRTWLWSSVVLATLVLGCHSPYRADRGALFGGATGAGVGALIGHATGNTGAGAAIGAGVGALTGAAIGGSLDEIEARNRAEIEARLGRPVAAGAVTVDEVVAMWAAGVDEQVIVTHIRSHGVAKIPDTGDLIHLQNNRVSPRVIQAMQEPAPVARPVVVQQAPGPVIVEEYYGPPWPGPYYHRHYYHRHCGPPPGVGIGFSYSSH